MASVIVLLAVARHALAQSVEECQSAPACRGHLQAAVAAYQAGLWEKAQQEFTIAYTIRQSPGLLINIGLCHLQQGQFREATAACEQYVRDAGSGDAGERSRAQSCLRQASERRTSAAPAATPVPAEPPPGQAPYPSELVLPKDTSPGDTLEGAGSASAPAPPRPGADAPSPAATGKSLRLALYGSFGSSGALSLPISTSLAGVSYSTGASLGVAIGLRYPIGRRWEFQSRLGLHFLMLPSSSVFFGSRYSFSVSSSYYGESISNGAPYWLVQLALEATMRLRLGRWGGPGYLGAGPALGGIFSSDVVRLTTTTGPAMSSSRVQYMVAAGYGGVVIEGGAALGKARRWEIGGRLLLAGGTNASFVFSLAGTAGFTFR